MSGADIYLDTSALLPFYRQEPLSEHVQSFLDKLRPPVCISDLTKVEIASAIARWVRTGELNEKQAVLLETTIADDIGAGLFAVRPLTARHYRCAQTYISTRTISIRTLDALHLACCALASLQLVTGDQIMDQAARQLGLNSTLLTIDRR